MSHIPTYRIHLIDLLAGLRALGTRAMMAVEERFCAKYNITLMNINVLFVYSSNLTLLLVSISLKVSLRNTHSKKTFCYKNQCK